MSVEAFERELAVVMSRPMKAGQRGLLDARVGLVIGRPRRSRQSAAIRLARTLALAVALSLALAMVFSVVGGGPLVIDPFGRPQYRGQDAAQYGAEVAAAMAVTPIPPGAAWPAWLHQPADPSAGYQIGAGRSVVEFNAACLWFEHWLTAAASGSSNERAAAAAGVLRMRGWWSWNDPIATRGSNFAAYMQSLIDSVVAGERLPVEEHVRVNCGG